MSVASIVADVRAAYREHVYVLPVKSDGTKRPDAETWRSFTHTRPSPEQMKAFAFAKRSGYGIVAGPVSDRREAWDFDELDTYHAFGAAAEACGLGDVVRRIEAGYCDETPNGGRRWIVQYPDTIDWRDVTLARRPGREGEPKVKTLIELPTFAIVAPSNGTTHPSGRPYIRRSGGFDTIASYTADERGNPFALARTFDAMPRPAASAATETHAAGDRPGDDFNRRAMWSAILMDVGARVRPRRGHIPRFQMHRRSRYVVRQPIIAPIFSRWAACSTR